MKKLLAAILLVLSVFLFVSCGGGDDTTDDDGAKAPAPTFTDSLGFVLTENDNGTYSVTDYLGKDTNITVPAKYNNASVTAIDSYAFQDCTTVLSIVIPSGITSIGENAFDSCTNLMRITIPETVNEIAQSAFFNCEKLVQITNLSEETLSFLPQNPGLEIRTSAEQDFKNVLQTVTDEEGNVLVAYDKNGVITYTVKETVGETLYETIYLLSYKSDEKVRDLSFYEYIDVVSPGAFASNTALTEITLPAGITVIGESAFSGCTALKTVKFANGSQLLNINRSAFEGCTALTSVSLPDTVTRFGVSAFKGCTALASINIPASLKRIGESCFGGCTTLENVNFDVNNELESIGAKAFDGCKALKSIAFPASVNSIALGALSGCSSLTSITLPFIGASTDSIDNTHFGYIFGASDWETQHEYIPTSLKTVFIKDYTTILSADDLPTHTTRIGKHAFNGCTSLTNVEISPCVTDIGKDAFAGCTALTNLTFKSLSYKMTESDEDGNLISNTVVFASQLKNIESGAFKGCTGLTRIDIPASVRFIANGAYEGCTNVKGVYISDVSAWCKIQFEDKLANPLVAVHNLHLNNSTTPTTDLLIIPEGTEHINQFTFAGLNNLKGILIPASMKKIDDFAFEDCASLENLYYASTAENWIEFLKIKDDKNNEIGTRNNADLASVTIYYYAFEKPALEGNYWYYDEAQNVKLWKDASDDVVSGAPSDKPSSDTPSGSDTPDGIVAGDFVFELNSKGTAYTIIAYTGKATELVLPSTHNKIAVTGIADNAFYRCTTLTSIEIPAGITTISYEAFRGCTSLKTVTFAKGTKTISLWALAYCTSLTDVIIPAEVTKIEDYAFYGASALANVYYSGTEAKWAEVTVGRNNEAIDSATVYFYSAKAPTADGNYWHYDASNKPLAW